MVEIIHFLLITNAISVKTEYILTKLEIKHCRNVSKVALAQNISNSSTEDYVPVHDIKCKRNQLEFLKH